MIRHSTCNAMHWSRLAASAIYEDKAGGTSADRPGLKEALDRLRADDTLVVWRLDRLGRSLKDLILRAEELHE